jgi:hypothetical protein
MSCASTRPPHRVAAVLLALGLGAACTPTVAVKPPEEPIVINMNIKIEHEIRVKVEKDLEEAFDDNEEIF